MVARFYSASNGGLPAHDAHNVGDLIVCIKAALITGYADKLSADWLMLYESASNAGDSSRRIVVQSQAPDSEQVVFEIEDLTATKGTVSCWQGWSVDTGIGLLCTAVINKAITWNGEIFIVATDKFVHLSAAVAYIAFGDAEVFDTTQTTTIILDVQSNAYSSAARAIASVRQPTRNKWRDMAGNKYVCRSFNANEDVGYGARIGAASAPIFDRYLGGDTHNSASQIETKLMQTQLLKEVSSGVYSDYGFLPASYYTDNPKTMIGKEIIDSSGQALKIEGWNLLDSGWQIFGVTA